MARKKSNPIKDIGETVGGWLNSAAKSTDVFLKGDQNPFIPTPARKGIGASQTVGDALSGGLVSAAKKGGDAFGKQMAVNAVTGAAISAAGAGVMKALRSPAVRGSVKGAINAASEYAPVMRKTMLNAIEEERRMSSQIASTLSKRAISASEAASKNRAAFMDTFEEYSPAYRNMLEDIAFGPPMRRSEINASIQANAKLGDIINDIPFDKTNEDLAKKYLRAKGSMARDAIPTQKLARKNNPDLQEEFQRRLQNQLMKTKFRREGLR